MSPTAVKNRVRCFFIILFHDLELEVDCFKLQFVRKGSVKSSTKCWFKLVTMANQSQCSNLCNPFAIIERVVLEDLLAHNALVLLGLGYLGANVRVCVRGSAQVWARHGHEHNRPRMCVGGWVGGWMCVCVGGLCMCARARV